MCDKVLFRHRESKMSAMNKISATSDSPFTFKREEGRGVFMVWKKNKPDFAQTIYGHIIKFVMLKYIILAELLLMFSGCHP